MADMHILKGDGKKWSIVMHFTVPAGNNANGVSWVDALVGSGLAVTKLTEGTSGWEVSTTEKASIEAGDVYEHQSAFLVESGGTTTAQLRASIREFYTARKAAVIARLKVQLRYFGHVESES